MEKRKKYIDQVVSIKYSDRKTPIYGLVIDYNENFTLLKYNPVDFVLDGYMILSHKNIQGFRRDKEEKFKEKIINLKIGNATNDKERNIPLTNLHAILLYLNENFGVFQFTTKSENACYLGGLASFNDNQLYVDLLDTTGKWIKPAKFRPNDIRTIEFDTDYINSLKLVAYKRK